MGLLDQPVFPLDHPDGKALRDDLAQIYLSAGKIESLCREAGLATGELHFSNAPAVVWTDVLDYAARVGKLRRLVEVIADDEESWPFRWLLLRLRAEPGEDPPAAEQPSTSAPSSASDDVVGGQRHPSGMSGVQVGDHNVQVNNYYYGQQVSSATEPPGGRRPYPGLVPFEGSDHEFFFGRDTAVDEVVRRLAANEAGIVIVSGERGAGKSSLLRAGVLPRLSRDGLPGNAAAKAWPRLLFTPGATPLDELAAQLAVVAGLSATEARQTLAANPQLFGRLARQAVLAHARRQRDQAGSDTAARQRLVLVVDQFEEVFSLCRSEEERRAFITALESAATSPEPSVLVVLGLDAGYESRCAAYPQLADAVRSRYPLVWMSERDLELAITEPAKRTGATVEPALVRCLLADAPHAAGMSPLPGWISRALAQVWQVHTGDVLTLTDYEQAVGAGAIHRDQETQAALRVVIDLEERRGELSLIVAGPPGLYSERSVTWAGSPGRRLLVAGNATGTVRDPAALADAVDQGRATQEELARYGQLLFDAAFGPEVWARLRQAAAGRPYLELAIRGGGNDDQAAMQSLRWEALHDGTRALLARDELLAEDSPAATVIRVMPYTGLSEGTLVRGGFQPVRRIPRVLFAVEGPAEQTDAEIADIVRQLQQNGVSISARVLRSVMLADILPELAVFQPDVLHLISVGQQPKAGRPDDGWVTAGDLLGAGLDPGDTPLMIVLSAGQTASAPGPSPAGGVQDHRDALPLAARMMAVGASVVIAMAGDIGDGERRAFTGALTTSVLQGTSLAQATAIGRQAVARDARFGAAQWAMPTVFLAEDVRSDLPLVDPEVSRAACERIALLGLAQEPLPFIDNEFAAAMDWLLDGSDPLNVLVGYTPHRDRDPDALRLLRELGAEAVRAGVLPVMLGPFGQSPPTTLDRLAREAAAAIRGVRASLGLEMSHLALEGLRAAVSLGQTSETSAARDGLSVDLTSAKVSAALHTDLERLAADLPRTDPTRERAGREPRVILLCHDIDRWQHALEDLAQMFGPSGLSGGEAPVPVVLTGAGVGGFGDVLPDDWRGRPWITAIPLLAPDGTDLTAEADEIRVLVAAGDYRQAQERLSRLAAEDPERAEPLKLELGFITLPEPDRRLVATAWSAIAAGHTVQSLLTEDESQSPQAGIPEEFFRFASPDTLRAVASMTAEAASVQQQAPATAPLRRPAQEPDAALGQATADLFARFFAVDPEEILSKLRRPGAGIPFGDDIELECAVAGSPAVRCHVECRSLDRRVTVDDIAGKLAQQKYHQRGAQIDHWILISPHHDAGSDLRGMLEAWDREGEYPFSVQVWSPETGVRELFALEPAVYEAVYGRPPTGEEASASAKVPGLIRQRLAPRLRLDAVWRQYLAEPGSFCFVNEDDRHFAGLYGRHLPLKAADEHGAPLGETLMEQVLGWAGDSTAAPMLLLADFGEGKSVFTYCLMRRLAEQFRAAPDGALFPLRIPLREFREAGSARGLLKRRLSEVGATLAQWRALAKQVRTLAVLDGFDEMSADLSPAAIAANLRDIRLCLTELSGSKVLVTSRQRVLDGSRDWRRTLDRLGKPRVMRIASGSRRERVRYLEQFAADEASARVLANLRSLYDPIGLAAKPLFLEMIKETLRELPDDTFSETILYETYINKSLRAKWELLADPGDELTSDELIENLKEILEDVAVRLQETNGAYMYLRDYQSKDRGKIAELLWQMRDQPVTRAPFSLAAQDDAANRVGIRSLLKAVPAPDAERWPVDFFHRSVREYFVARAIAHSLTTDAKRARQVLSAAPLLPEIAHFTATILRARPSEAALAALTRLTRSATTDRDDAYLGGNAFTLLHGAGGLLAERDWSGLRLDHARLRGADLRGARFAGSSLRYANLDNANLEDADLTGADLDGVRLEETSQVLAVTALDGNRVIAAYEDGSLREWRGRPGAGWESRVAAVLGHRAERLQVTPLGRVLAVGEGMLTVLDLVGGDGSAQPAGSAGFNGAPGDSRVRAAFRTSSRCRAALLGERIALFADEGDGGRLLVAWLDMVTARSLGKLSLDETVTAWAQLDDVLFAFATAGGIRVTWLHGEGRVTIADPAVTCLAVRPDGDGALLAAGHHDGSVSLTRLSPADLGAAVLRLTRRLHAGPVTGIHLDTEEQVITGSTDRTVGVTPLSAFQPNTPASENAEPAGQRLYLTLRCQGVRFAGVRTEREQEKLRRYAESASGPPRPGLPSLRRTDDEDRPGIG